jgi:hypothetical protein
MKNIAIVRQGTSRPLCVAIAGSVAGAAAIRRSPASCVLMVPYRWDFNLKNSYLISKNRNLWVIYIG